MAEMAIELSGAAIFATILVLVAVVIVFAGVKVVPQGNEYTLERFGRYTRTMRPGLHLIIPLVDNHQWAVVSAGQDFSCERSYRPLDGYKLLRHFSIIKLFY